MFRIDFILQQQKLFVHPLRHFGIEPHQNEVVENGNELIKQLAEKFQPEVFE